jgi:hypothetical protein
MNDVEAKIPESKNTNLEEAYIDEYWSTYRQHIHTLLAWGYADSRNRVQAKHDEPAITGFIAEAIQDRLDAFDSPPLRNIQVVGPALRNESDSRKVNNCGTVSGRTRIAATIDQCARLLKNSAVLP